MKKCITYTLLAAILILSNSCISVWGYCFRNTNYSDYYIQSDSLIKFNIEYAKNIEYSSIDTQKVAKLLIVINIENVYSEPIWIDEIVHKANFYTDIDIGRFYIFSEGFDHNRFTGRKIKICKDENYHCTYTIPIYNSYTGNLKFEYTGRIYNKKKKIINDQVKISNSIYIKVEL